MPPESRSVSGSPRSCLRRLVPALLIFVIVWGQAHAAVRVTVYALFKNKAVVSVDGRRRVLSVGVPSPEGVLLISADSRAAVLEIDGQRKRYILSDHVNSHYSAASQRVVRIWPDSAGMYTTVGSINGYPVDFMLDTGASSVAMNTAQARRLGIDFRVLGREGVASTAGGMVRAYFVKLDLVAVGEIRLRNVDAAVLEGAHPGPVLLGMSFLGRLKIENQGRAMVLKQQR